jgi:hypothetical protein
VGRFDAVDDNDAHTDASTSADTDASTAACRHHRTNGVVHIAVE